MKHDLHEIFLGLLGIINNRFNRLLKCQQLYLFRYALTKHPLLWDFVKQQDIAIEICPISNQVLSLVEDMRNHPAASLFASGSPVVVSNDDPALWGAKGLSYDFYEAFMGIMSANSDLRSLKKLALNSLTYSSMNSSQKQDAITRWHVKWDTFVTRLAESSS